jgi:hypothetical protein
MNRYVVMVSIALATLASSGAAAQTAKDLVGTWTLDAAGGFGVNPKGYVMFDANGHFGALLMRSDLPKYASNRRTQGTAEEYKATVQGMIAYYGTYSVDGKDVNLHIEGSSFPNWNGTDQKRTDLSITGEEMRWTQPATSGGGHPAETLWKRAR